MLAPACVWAQSDTGRSGPWTHRSWSADEGLPQNTATALAQTSDGYLWVGTYKGLARFDGLKFTTFETANSPGLSGDRITRLLGSSDGSLWIGTEWNGLSVYRDGRFYDLSGHPDSSHAQAANSGMVRGDFIRLLYEDADRNVWIGVRGGLYRFDGQRFDVIDLAENGSVTPTDMTEDHSGVHWLATSRGLAVVEDLTIDWPDDLPEFARSPVARLATNRAGRVWLLSTAGFGSLSSERPSDLLGFSSGHAIAADNTGRLWIATRERGLVYFEQDRLSDEGLPGSLDSGFLRDILVTDDGIVWVAGGDQGLHRLQPRLFEAYVPQDRGSGLSVNRVADAGQGVIWAGSLTAGLWKIEDGRIELLSSRVGLPRSNANLLTTTSDGTAWITSGNQTLSAPDGVFRLPPGFDDGGMPPSVSLARRSAGGVWIATPGRIYAHHDGELSEPIEIPEIGQDVVFEMIDRTGVLWLAPRSGLLCGVSGRKTECFGSESGIPQKNIRDVLENPDGSVWFGAYGAGLCRLFRDQVRCLSRDHGLLDNTAHRILEDDYGFVWISSNKGVTRMARTEIEAFFEGETDQVWGDHFGVADGMPSAECNIGGVKDAEGRLWFPTMHGVTSVDPGHAFTYTVGESRAHIEAVVSDGAVQKLEDHLSLEPGTDRIEFAFTGINFGAPDRVRFRARLIGHDDDWIDFGNARTTSYTNLGPGDYRFEVESAVGSAGWSEAASQTVTIQPFFYQTIWFRILTMILVGIMAVSVYRARVNRLLERERLQKSEAETRRLADLDAAKSRFFANISHEFRTPLTLIISPTEEILESDLLDHDQRRWGEAVLNNARRLLHLIDRLLDLSRLEAGRLELGYETAELVTFVERIVERFAPAAEKKDILLRFRSDIPARPTSFDPDKLQSIVGNLLSNALKYTPAGGKTWVSLRETETGDVEFVVKDTGPGIPPEQVSRLFERFVRGSDGRGDETIGSGIGLALVKELVDLHGGVLLVESEVGFGTAFIVRLPLARSTIGMVGAAHPANQTAEAGAHEGDAGNPDYSGVRPDLVEEKPVVLLVEDNSEVRALLKRQLDPSFHVVEAHDGAVGLQAARDLHPDVILSDVMMPVMDGLALCAAIRADETLRHTPIVLLTAKADDASAAAAIDSGADDYIEKPYHAATLKQKLNRLVDVRRSLRDEYSGQLVMPSTGVVVESSEQHFASLVVETISDHLGDPRFSVEALAAETGLSRRQLTRRVKSVFGETPSDLVHRLRMEQAARYLEARSGSVSEIAYKVGFKSASHFSTAFKEAYGHKPSEHQRDDRSADHSH